MDFYRQAHQGIYEAMLRLHRAHTECDMVTLVNALRAVDRLDQCGGFAYLTRLIDAIPCSLNVEAHAAIIIEKSKKRRLIVAAQNLAAAAYDDLAPAEDLLCSVQKDLLAVEARSEGEVSAQTLVAECSAEYEWRAAHPGVTGVPSGIPGLDRILSGFQDTDLIVIAARPGMGKTALSVNLLDYAASHGFPTWMCSLEMSRKQIGNRLFGARARINTRRLQSGHLSANWEQVSNAAAEIHAQEFWIDDSPGLDVNAIRMRALRAVTEHKVRFILIDYLQKVRVPSGRKRNEAIGEVASTLKNLAREAHIPVVALAQMNRGVEMREDKRPQLSDLKDSGEIEQECDVVAFMHGVGKKGDEPFRVDLLIEKNRNGPTGDVPLLFWKEFQIFGEVERAR